MVYRETLASNAEEKRFAVKEITRREILRSLGLSAAALAVQRSSFAYAAPGPNDKLSIACIGVGAQGVRVLLDLIRLEQVQVVAVCDVNRGSSNYLEWGPDELRTKVRTVLQDSSFGSQWQGPTAGRTVAQEITNAFYAREHQAKSTCNAYEDFRELLEREKDLDAVIISTPDHWHALIAITAMRAGKHVYSQKPMAHSVWEARAMERVARETGRATQVSIFDSDTLATQQVHQLMQTGIIGTVKGVDIWTTRPAAFWKQGLPTPTQTDPIPEGFNWDLWLGPAAARPYNHEYLPFVWRAWYDFGCGALGDMGEYGFDTIMRALNLGIPDVIDASSTQHFPESYPVASAVRFRYPKTDQRGEVLLNWFDGGIRPGRPRELPLDASLSVDNEGVLYTGETGKLLTAFMGQSARLLTPDGKLSDAVPLVPKGHQEPFIVGRPELGVSATAADAEHYLEWVRACHGGPPSRANYSFERPIVEALMLGCIATRTRELLEWDSESAQFTRGSTEATALLKPEFRQPWSI